jgi:hypothetical protein
MGYIREYRNGYYSTSMIENADFADSFEMIRVIAGLSVMRVLNNRSYLSSPRLYNFVKYRIPIDRIIQEQIQTHRRNNSTVRKRWENTRAFIQYVQHTRDQNCFL